MRREFFEMILIASALFAVTCCTDPKDVAGLGGECGSETGCADGLVCKHSVCRESNPDGALTFNPKGGADATVTSDGGRPPVNPKDGGVWGTDLSHLPCAAKVLTWRFDQWDKDVLSETLKTDDGLLVKAGDRGSTGDGQPGGALVKVVRDKKGLVLEAGSPVTITHGDRVMRNAWLEVVSGSVSVRTSRGDDGKTAAEQVYTSGRIDLTDDFPHRLTEIRLKSQTASCVLAAFGVSVHKGVVAKFSALTSGQSARIEEAGVVATGSADLVIRQYDGLGVKGGSQDTNIDGNERVSFSFEGPAIDVMYSIGFASNLDGDKFIGEVELEAFDSPGKSLGALAIEGFSGEDVSARFDNKAISSFALTARNDGIQITSVRYACGKAPSAQ